MKTFICFAFVIALTLAEPPSYRQQFQRDRPTYYVAKQQEHEPEAETESPVESPSDAPYPASGWKPDGPEFELPQKQQQSAPNQQYGAPAKIDNQYGAPAVTSQKQVASFTNQRQFAASQQQYNAPQQQYNAPQQQYNVPQQQYNVPQVQYNPQQQQYSVPQQNPAPQQNYGAPQQQYGAPQATSTESSTDTDYEESTTLSSATESESGSVESVNELNEDDESNEQQKQSGEYFIALPDGRLQRVQYISSQNIEAMKYFAKIRAENVEPLRGPIYAYQPLQKLQFAPTQLQVPAFEEAVVPVAPAVVSEVRGNNVRGQKIVQASAVSTSSATSSSAKLQVQPLAAELPGAPLSTSYATYMANYQVPNAEQRYFITF